MPANSRWDLIRGLKGQGKNITGLSFVEKEKQDREIMGDIFWRFDLIIINK